MKNRKVTTSLISLIAVLCLCSQSAYAQQEKGDKEVLVFSGGFIIGTGDNSDFDNAFLGGKVGYFLTRRHEVGGELGMSFTRFRSSSCRELENGDFECTPRSDKHFGLNLGAFYRFNFAARGRKGYPYLGLSVISSDLFRGENETDFGGADFRPEVGYKYFVKKNVAFDLSVGYRLNTNFGASDFIDGRLGLTFIF